MRFTDLFIKRPVLSIVVSLVILLAGLQSKPTAGTPLPWIQLNAESTFNLGLIIDAGATLSGVTDFTSGLVGRYFGQ